MAKIFRGVTPAARPLSRVWSIMKPMLRFSIGIINDWSGPPSLQVSPRIKSLAGHRDSNGCTESITRSSRSGHGAPELSPRTERLAEPLPIPPRHSAPPSARTCSYPACGTQPDNIFRELTQTLISESGDKYAIPHFFLMVCFSKGS